MVEPIQLPPKNKNNNKIIEIVQLLLRNTTTLKSVKYGEDQQMTLFRAQVVFSLFGTW